MTPAVASERSIFSKNHDCNSYSYRVFRVAVNTYAPIFWGVDARGGRKLYTNNTHTRGTATVTIIMKSTKVQTLGGNIGTFGLETPICMHMY